MKKATILIILSAIVFSCFVACRQDVENDTLVGSWRHETGGHVLTFRTDKTMTVSFPSNPGLTMNYTYSVDGDVLTLTFGGGSTMQKHYSLSGDVLILDEDRYGRI